MKKLIRAAAVNGGAGCVGADFRLNVRDADTRSVARRLVEKNTKRN